MGCDPPPTPTFFFFSRHAGPTLLNGFVADSLPFLAPAERVLVRQRPAEGTAAAAAARQLAGSRPTLTDDVLAKAPSKQNLCH